MTPGIEPIDWEARLHAAVEQTIRDRQARRDLRQQLAERRDHGLKARHATKLGRGNGHQVPDDQGPTTEPDIHIPGPTTPPAEQAANLPLDGPTRAHRADNPANAAGGHPQTGDDQHQHQRASTSRRSAGSVPSTSVADGLLPIGSNHPAVTVSDETPTKADSANQAAALNRLRRAGQGGYRPSQEN